LVRAKRALGNQLRGLLRPFGIRLPSRQGTKKFAEAAHQAGRRDNMSWGLKLMKRRGPKRARVAVARRRAILLGRIWKDKTHFDAVPA
jgi:hypothetical protein